jgi:hypothetical protein
VVGRFTPEERAQVFAEYGARRPQRRSGYLAEEKISSFTGIVIVKFTAEVR